MIKDTILNGDALEVLKTLPDQFVQCVVTSPPYWGLRDYGVDGQMGLEKSPEEFIEKMVVLFREVRRVLKGDGTMWLNIGDTYYGGKGHNGASQTYKNNRTLNSSALISTSPGVTCVNDLPQKGLKPKDLVGIPWMLAFALRADGWYLRQDIIWHKPNPMPESVTDRCTRSHEYLFMFSKSRKYFYDAYAIRQPYQPKTFTTFGIESSGHGDGSGLVQSENWAKDIKVRKPKDWNKEDKQRGHSRRHAGFNDRWDKMTVEEQQAMGANKRSVWTVSTSGFKDAHFATFPEELIVDCIKAGTRSSDIVLDPFMGAGTTALVAKKQGRHYIGIELNPAYIEIANNRLKKELGLFA